MLKIFELIRLHCKFTTITTITTAERAKYVGNKNYFWNSNFLLNSYILIYLCMLVVSNANVFADQNFQNIWWTCFNADNFACTTFTSERWKSKTKHVSLSVWAECMSNILYLCVSEWGKKSSNAVMYRKMCAKQNSKHFWWKKSDAICLVCTQQST